MKITLKACRINSGLTLDEVSRMINVNKRTLINYENGKSIPSSITLDKLLLLYCVDYNDIFLGNTSTLSKHYLGFRTTSHQDSA